MDFAEYKLRVVRALGGESVTDLLLYDAVQSALDAVLPWQPQRKVQELTGDATTVEYSLETDAYEIDGVQLEENGEFIPLAMLAPGVTRGEKLGGINDWIEYPSGTLAFSKEIGADYKAYVYYRAHWGKPASVSDDDFDLPTPAFLDMALVIYGAAYCLMPAAVETASIRQYNIKVDSGNPEHNPVADRVEFLLKLFNADMNSHPKTSHGSHF
jgi:hypothetical protein